MAELVDAADLKSVDRKVVRVQVPLRALPLFHWNTGGLAVFQEFALSSAHFVDSAYSGIFWTGNALILSKTV